MPIRPSQLRKQRAAKEAADKAAAKKAADEAEIKNRADYYRQQQEQAIGPAQQDQAMRQQMYQEQPQTLFNSLSGSRSNGWTGNEYQSGVKTDEQGRKYYETATGRQMPVRRYIDESPTQPNQNSTEQINRPRMESQVTPYNKFSRISKDYQPISKDGMNLENGPKKEPVIMYKPGREIEPPEQRINLDQFIARERRPVTPNPLRLGPLQQFNSMQQQMYQTEPAEPQPEIAQPMQKQEEPKIPAQQTTQAKEQEQQPVQPVKQKMMKRRM